MENQRYITLTFLAAAAMIGITVRSAVVEGIAIAGWADPLFLNLIQLSVLIAIGVGIASFAVMLRNEQAVSFVDEVVVEMRKVFWPDRDETINSTTIVIVTCFIITASLASFDFIWAKVTGIFLFS
jgi:preprotein translocase SecE subunit